MKCSYYLLEERISVIKAVKIYFLTWHSKRNLLPDTVYESFNDIINNTLNGTFIVDAEVILYDSFSSIIHKSWEKWVEVREVRAEKKKIKVTRMVTFVSYG